MEKSIECDNTDSYLLATEDDSYDHKILLEIMPVFVYRDKRRVVGKQLRCE